MFEEEWKKGIQWTEETEGECYQEMGEEVEEWEQGQIVVWVVKCDDVEDVG